MTLWHWRGLFGLILGQLTAVTLNVNACGPFFPESVLDQPKAVLRPPFVNFEAEVRQLSPPSPPPAVAPPLPESAENSDPPYRFVDDDLLKPEFDEMRQILSSLPPPRRGQLFDEYHSLRSAMIAKFPPANFETFSRWRQPENYEILANAELGKWPEGLPGEIVLYLEGALQYHYGNRPAAIEIWKRLLALPPKERRNRSTWAAWMIAKATREESGLAAAAPWYEECIRLSSEGYSDALKLGLTSLGWLARQELQQGHRRRALELYYHQARAGDVRGWSSLRQSLPDPEKLSDAELIEMAADPFQRGLLTAELLGGNFDWHRFSGDSDSPQTPSIVRWLNALEHANAGNLAEAARWAELAYSDGQFDLAKRWLARAPESDPRALWIRGKLALMEG
ncbi:MAG TPA: hypothetical protein VIS74_01845, partial [Chthoniobacterales bacterium]